MAKVILKIGGMSCSACSNRLEKYLNKQEGVIQARVNLVLNEAVIEYEPYLTVPELEQFVKQAGYESLGIYKEKKEKEPNKEKTLLIIFGFLAFILMYISMGEMLNLPTLNILSMHKEPKIYALVLLFLTIPFLIYGFPIFKGGIKNIFNKAPNMDTLVTLGVMASFSYSFYNLILILIHNNMYELYFESSALVLYFIKIGRFITEKSKAQTKKALEKLVTITPEYALLKKDKDEIKVTIDEVKKGDILICKPGSKIAVDGEIIKGEAYIDESFLTGESTPVKKTIKAPVMAGSINLNGYLEYKAQKVGPESTISEIVHLVLEASSTKAKVSLLADKVSGYFVPTVIILAFLTFFVHLILRAPFSVALNHFVSVLVVSCPCALGLATPLALVVSLGLCAEKGLLIKSNEILENASKIDTVVFDKTGTLTYGNLKISQIFNYSSQTEKELLTIICSMEAKSQHPIATAFNNYREEHKLELYEINNFENLAGLGLKATVNNKEVYVGSAEMCSKLKIETPLNDAQKLTQEGNSLVYLIMAEKLVALIGVKDIIRDSTKVALSNLTKMHKNLIMLTGDNEKTAKTIAEALNIEQVYANTMPKAKISLIKKLLEQGKKVMFVGDGINDAPGLAQATMAVSIGSATDIAIDSADVIILNNNLELLAMLFKISKKTLKIIKENLFWAFFYNILMLPIAMGLLEFAGLSLNPMVAAMAMTLSSLTVVLNSLRLKKI